MDRQPMAGPVRVAVVEDQPVAVEGIRHWFERDPGRRVRLIAAGDDLDRVLTSAGAEADVLLLDLQLHGRRITDRIAGVCDAGHRVVVFSALTDDETIRTVHAAGAFGFLSKDEPEEHLIEALVAAAADRPYVTPSVAAAIVTDTAVRPRLSDQERRVLQLWFQSGSKQSVALRMGVSERTVKEYIDRARLKYTREGRVVRTQFALLARAIEDGLIRPEDIQDYRSAARRPSAEETTGDPSRRELY